MSQLRCERCGTAFSLPPQVQARYPGWRPTRCRRCAAGGASRTTRGGRGDVAERPGEPDSGPDTGVFTDGSAEGNPGPGGWGAVYVSGGDVVAEASGRVEHTTNNRMELTAILRGLDLVPAGTATTLYSDSQYAVRTVTEWAAGWEARGWRRRTGPVENLELVKEAYAAARARPEITIGWIRGHAGARWNEYADALANGRQPARSETRGADSITQRKD